MKKEIKSKSNSRKVSAVEIKSYKPIEKKTINEIIGEIDFKPKVSKKDAESIRRNSAFTSRTQRTNSESMLNQKRERTKMLKPRIFIQEDGKIIVEQPKISDVNEKLASNTNLTATFEDKERLTSLSFKKKVPFKKWSKEETDLFYKGLECFGTDFSLFTCVFPERSRLQLKNKLHKEENTNSEKIKSHLSKFDKNKLGMIIPLITKLLKSEDYNMNSEDKKSKFKDLRIILLNDTTNINLITEDTSINKIVKKELRSKSNSGATDHNEGQVLEKFITTFL